MEQDSSQELILVLGEPGGAGENPEHKELEHEELGYVLCCGWLCEPGDEPADEDEDEHYLAPTIRALRRAPLAMLPM